MAATAAVQPPLRSVPRFQAEADALARQLMACSVETLQAMLHCNARIAALNKLRYETFFDDAPPLPAVLAYAGQAFKHLRADTFAADDFRFAQEHLWLTSFLYGLLRPLDGVRCYRLEGTAQLPDTGERVFDFWRSRLTDCLLDSVRRDDGVLVNLASEEMKLLFDWARVEREAHVVQPEFKVEKPEGLKTVVVYAKMCRGAMARYLLRHRCTRPDDLRDFSYEGFAHRRDWLFTV